MHQDGPRRLREGPRGSTCDVPRFGPIDIRIGLIEPVFSFRWHAPFYSIDARAGSSRMLQRRGYTSWPGTARGAAVSGSAAAAADALRAWIREAAARAQTTWSVAGEQGMFSLRIVAPPRTAHRFPSVPIAHRNNVSLGVFDLCGSPPIPHRNNVWMGF